MRFRMEGKREEGRRDGGKEIEEEGDNIDNDKWGGKAEGWK